MMQKLITVVHSNNNKEILINLSYKIEIDDDIQLIHCTVTVDNKTLPSWLHLRKFELRSRFIDGTYVPLFSDNDKINNINSVLFIDNVYTEIMKAEKFQMALS